MLYRLQIDIAGRDEALALAELIREMGYEVNTFAKQCEHKPISETRAGKIVLAAMQHNRTYTNEDIAMILEENDYSANSGNSILYGLYNEGLVKRLSAGLYRRVA